ncbi:MAG: trypsin-like peptidase domain-containing protein, partial [Planctomycetaceae bacterium]|nr:trypsin-like peptidase domain-containing protein [Planctomycetaceae bacterium]
PIDVPIQATPGSAAAAAESSTASLAERPPILGTVELIALVEPAVVRINALDESGELEWHGSGFVVDPSGIVVTNAHVISGAAQCVAVFENGTKCPVTGYYALQEKNDLAVIGIEPPKGEEFPALRLAPEPPRKGDTVFAFGCPHGLDFTASDGIVSSIRSAQDIEGLRGEPTQGDWLQTTAPISQGNSGGPLVNARGEVVGVNSMVHRLGQNLNFAVAATEVRGELDGRSAALTKLSRSTAPDGNPRMRGEDLTKSPLGKEKLAGVKKIAVLALTNTWSKAEHTINVFRNTARFEFKRAGIEVVSIPNDDLPVLFVGIAYHGPYGRSGPMSVQAFLVVPEKTESGLPKLYTIWENEADLGSATRGESLGSADLRKIKDFFRGFVADYEAAVAAQKQLANEAATKP